MPDAWTHMLCGDEAIEKLNIGLYKDALKNNIKVFHLGCQGPDPFLYYRFFNKKEHEKVEELGEMIHRENTRDFFLEGLNFLKGLNDKQQFKALFSYMIGFICHYALDSHAHPYIYYFSGIYNPSEPSTKKYNSFHKKLEVIIDTILLMERKNLKAYKVDLYKEIDLGEDFPRVLDEFYNRVFPKVFSVKPEENLFSKASNEMVKALKLLKDTTGIKRTLLYIPELFGAEEMKIKNAIYPKSIDNKDYLNKQHKVWNHPCSRDEVTNKSFYELFDEAVKESREIITLAIAYLDNKIDMESLKMKFPNVSYGTGKSLLKNCEPKYFKCIFEA